MLSVILIGALLRSVGGQVLTPPYFNLAEGRRITASSTCGEGVDEPELYCKLVGANSDKPIEFNVIKGQVCLNFLMCCCDKKWGELLVSF